MVLLKNILFIVFYTFCIAISINGTTDHLNQDPVSGIVWDKLLHDFGNVNEGDLAETVFTATNNRKDTLIIENVQGTCGCIVSSWPHQPILPGTDAGIKVGFNSEGKSGANSKSVTVYTNKGYFTLRLKANVVHQ